MAAHSSPRPYPPHTHTQQKILNYECVNRQTQELLNTDIHTNVTKQNELRAQQAMILIQEQANEVQRKQKDLEVQMAMKDNEVALQKKQLENSIRIKEMDIEIQEEHKRTELLEVRAGGRVKAYMCIYIVVFVDGGECRNALYVL